MFKRTVFTTITPLPAGVSRETVLEFLHDHVSMIDLNPLVIERHVIRPPRSTTAEEFHCTWYSLTDRVSYIPRVSGEVSYNACFHDLFDGVQTHVYAPLGLDIKEKWSIGGSLPGELQAPIELGLNIPSQGLYLREDCDMHCNIVMNKFVKGTLKKAHGVLVDRLVTQAGIEDSRRQSRKVSAMSTPRDSVHADIANSLFRPPSVPSSEAASVSSGGAHSILSRPSSSHSSVQQPPPPRELDPPTPHIAELDSTELVVTASKKEPEGAAEPDSNMSMEDVVQQKLAEDIAAYFSGEVTSPIARPTNPTNTRSSQLPPYRPDKYRAFASATAPLKPSYTAYRPPPVKVNSYTAYQPGASLAPEKPVRPRSHLGLSATNLHLSETNGSVTSPPVELEG